MEASEIIEHKDTIKEFANNVRQSDDFEEFHETYLHIRGYAYRLEDAQQRLFYTFSEAVSSVDMAKLMRDDEALKMNCQIYLIILDICIDEFLGQAINEEEKQKAIDSYKELEKQKSKENKKYHTYQY